MGAGDFGDVVCPVFPMMAVAAFFHDFGIQGAFDFADFKLDFGLLRRRGIAAADTIACLCFAQGIFFFAAAFDFGRYFVGNGHHFHFMGVLAVEFELVNHGVEAVVVSAQGIQHLPHHTVVFVFIQRIFCFHASGNHHRQNHIALLFAFGTAHHATDRLHHIYLRIARGKKQYGI